MAEVLTYEGIAAVSTTADTSAAAIGDRYLFRFSYDDQAVDVDIGADIGEAHDGLVQFEVSALPGNQGTFDPASLSYTPFAINTNNDIGDPTYDLFSASADVPATSFGGYEILMVTINLASFDLSLLDDLGRGQTIDQITGGPLPDNVAFYDRAAYVLFKGNVGGPLPLNADIISLRRVPEPGGLALAGLIGLVFIRRCGQEATLDGVRSAPR